MLQRCSWAGSDPLYQRYHDEEWGVPVRDDRQLFEFLILEGAQAGLSWITVLRKRERYRQVFDAFDPEAVASYDERKIQSLLEDPGIVRNRAKVRSAVGNAQAFLELREAQGTFADYLWNWVDGEPIQNRWKTMAEVPAVTPLSEALSKDLKKRGFRFVGPTIVYAYMQAIGMVNDHVTTCWRHAELSAD